MRFGGISVVGFGVLGLLLFLLLLVIGFTISCLIAWALLALATVFVPFTITFVKVLAGGAILFLLHGLFGGK